MREVVVTGIGMVSCRGEGAEAHLAALQDAAPPPVADLLPSYPVHPLAAIDFDRQIPKKSDQRQMEPWQKIGCYAAGLALDSAGLKDDAALKARMHLIVAAGGGERDYAVDGHILAGLREAENPGIYLNERLMNDIRPTLFLAQLSNLLAGNISIVHGVTGASRTFMGEEAAGLDAIRIAQARIAAGQADIILVGGAYNAERPDVLLIYEMAGLLWKKPWASVWERAAPGGFVLGSAGAFLVLESREYANARGAEAMAQITSVASSRRPRAPGSIKASLEALSRDLPSLADPITVSGATGRSEIAGEEHEALKTFWPQGKIYATGDLIGHALEAQAPFGAALGALLLKEGKAQAAIVSSVGHQRGEGVMLLQR